MRTVSEARAKIRPPEGQPRKQPSQGEGKFSCRGQLTWAVQARPPGGSRRRTQCPEWPCPPLARGTSKGEGHSTACA
eukprot:13469552-Alexandrium_andersonii.AAC.1